MAEEVVGHITVGLTQRECEVLAELSERMDLPQERIMVLALRLYQSACDGHEALSKLTIPQTDIVEAIDTWLIMRDVGSYNGRLLLAARNEIEQLRKQINLQTWTGGDGKPPGITMRISE